MQFFFFVSLGGDLLFKFEPQNSMFLALVEKIPPNSATLFHCNFETFRRSMERNLLQHESTLERAACIMVERK